MELIVSKVELAPKIAQGRDVVEPIAFQRPGESGIVGSQKRLPQPGSAFPKPGASVPDKAIFHVISYFSSRRCLGRPDKSACSRNRQTEHGSQ